MYHGAFLTCSLIHEAYYTIRRGESFPEGKGSGDVNPKMQLRLFTNLGKSGALPRLHIQIHAKLNQSLYRPGQALRVPGILGSQISRQSAHEGGKVVSSTHRPPLPPVDTLVLIFVRG